MFYQLLVSDDTSLFEAIQDLLNVNVDSPLVFDQYGEVVSINDFLWVKGMRMNSGSGKTLFK